MSTLTNGGVTLIVSTLGAPDRPLADIARMTQAAGASGLELRVAAGQPVALGCSAADLAKARSDCARYGQEIVTVASYLQAADVDCDDPQATLRTAGTRRDPFTDEAAEYCRIGRGIGARFLRVFPGGPVADCPRDRVPEPLVPGELMDEVASRRLVALASAASRYGLTVLLETHDSHPRGQDVARVLHQVAQRTEHPVGAIWDVLHPWRVGESFTDTWKELTEFLSPTGVGYLQIKDARSAQERTPELPGRGAIGLRQWWQVVSEGGFDGPVALEWERAWHPQIPPLAAALAATAEWLNRNASPSASSKG